MYILNHTNELTHNREIEIARFKYYFIAVVYAWMFDLEIKKIKL